MGVIGEMFPGRKLTDEDSEAGDGQPHRPRLEFDLDGGVVRLPARPRSAEQGVRDGESE
ncbi:hypothetical protein [Nocardia macrotermitis]|uniref:Uncharacterized protein n=1 Tax=Nocardia macrotermitis TaxID=2585198 RepID=A0A7K0DH04_9NOCA|nr:hypothetical protein [Nocardia macrotermitis]MQY24074.1 hypothetical protein [Nocardia macrotermitis]